MAKSVFVLRNKNVYRRGVRVFIKGLNKKFEGKLLPFSKEHLIIDKERNKPKARNVAAEYATDDPILINALLSDTGYGKDFVLKNDPEGKKKRVSAKITNADHKRIGLQRLFGYINLPWDDELPTEVLESQYATHVNALGSVDASKSTATQIPVKEVDPLAELEAGKEAAREAYKEKYGEEIPGDFVNDIALLDGMSNPDFDAQAYIEANTQKDEPSSKNVETAEYWQEEYKKALGTAVANPMKNNIEWMKKKIAEAK